MMWTSLCGLGAWEDKMVTEGADPTRGVKEVSLVWEVIDDQRKSHMKNAEFLKNLEHRKLRGFETNESAKGL